MAIAKNTQMMAAPITSESVTGAASTICGIDLRAAIDERRQVAASTKSRFIMIPYCTGSGRSRPKSWRTAARVSGSALRPGDPRRRVDARRGEEDQEHEHADAEHDEQRRSSRRMMNAITRPPACRPKPDLGARVERVAHAVAQHVEREHGEHDGEAGRDRHPGPRVEQALPVLDDRAPAGVRRLHADRQERERRFGQHAGREHQREEHDQGRDDVGQDVARRAGAGCSRPGRSRPGRTPSARSESTSPRIGRAT